MNGKFVVFVYANTNDVCGMADRWKPGNTVGAYVVLKVFPGFGACASQPDSWHQYSPAVATDQQGTLSARHQPRVLEERRRRAPGARSAALGQ